MKRGMERTSPSRDSYGANTGLLGCVEVAILRRFLVFSAQCRVA